MLVPPGYLPAPLSLYVSVLHYCTLWTSVLYRTRRCSCRLIIEAYFGIVIFNGDDAIDRYVQTILCVILCLALVYLERLGLEEIRD